MVVKIGGGGGGVEFCYIDKVVVWMQEQFVLVLLDQCFDVDVGGCVQQCVVFGYGLGCEQFKVWG